MFFFFLFYFKKKDKPPEEKGICDIFKMNILDKPKKNYN